MFINIKAVYTKVSTKEKLNFTKLHVVGEEVKTRTCLAAHDCLSSGQLKTKEVYIFNQYNAIMVGSLETDKKALTNWLLHKKHRFFGNF